MKRLLLVVLCCGLIGVLWRPQAVSNPVFEPDTNQTYTSTHEVEQLLIRDNTLWALTGGGVLRFQNNTWKKFKDTPPEFNSRKNAANTISQWRGQTVVPTFESLQIGTGKATGKAKRIVALPPSAGTHISAVLPRGNNLWVAMFGDGIWQWDGSRWTQPQLNLPTKAREITALAQSSDGKTLWLGTRRQGIWRLQSNAWKQFLQPDEPFAHNVQFLQSYQNALWASTLEDGLVVRDARGWRHYDKSALSSNAPRQMVVFQKKLYVRHPNEVVDCSDGRTWKKNIFPALPRKHIISIAADANHLYLGQWGGWSEWDGSTFTHRLRIPELQIVPLMQIFPDNTSSPSGRLWLGTENRGLFEWDAKGQQLRHYDERDGLPDDWITTLARNKSTLFAGTFNGGLAWRNDNETKWHVASTLNRVGITAIVEDNSQRTWVATRFGLYSCNEKQVLSEWNQMLAPNEREIQALLKTPHGLWIGTRNGLLYRRDMSV